jgi:hypothetical protein
VAPRGLLTGWLSPQPRVLRSGTKAVELTAEQMSCSVVTRQTDGGLTMRCVDGAGKAQCLVEAARRPWPRRERARPWHALNASAAAWRRACRP